MCILSVGHAVNNGHTSLWTNHKKKEAHANATGQLQLVLMRAQSARAVVKENRFLSGKTTPKGVVLFLLRRMNIFGLAYLKRA